MRSRNALQEQKAFPGGRLAPGTKYISSLNINGDLYPSSKIEGKLEFSKSKFFVVRSLLRDDVRVAADDANWRTVVEGQSTASIGLINNTASRQRHGRKTGFRRIDIIKCSLQGVHKNNLERLPMSGKPLWDSSRTVVVIKPINFILSPVGF